MEPERTKEGFFKYVTFELHFKDQEEKGAVFHEGKKARNVLGLICHTNFLNLPLFLKKHCPETEVVKQIKAAFFPELAAQSLPVLGACVLPRYCHRSGQLLEHPMETTDGASL